MPRRHLERHQIARIGWLRAAVLGANDGIISTASLMLGVATASHSKSGILIAGISGLVAGALSMASGEYVSVSSQADVEKSALAQERRELKEDGDAELTELARIYVHRGLEPDLARQVAVQLTRKDALAAHARDELGLSEELSARPLQAAFASAVSFSCGAVVPLLAAILVPVAWSIIAVYTTSLIVLVVLGAIGARTGGAPAFVGAVRVGFWGTIAMAVTAGIGTLFHVQL
jgi:VIT1/CCC1 family predicted Fe2+/Mn2+ transporter